MDLEDFSTGLAVAVRGEGRVLEIGVVGHLEGFLSLKERC